MKSVLADIESQIAQLSQAEQILLIEKLAQCLRTGDQTAWEDDLAAMAADPEIQAELRQINQEFAGTEQDGLERGE